MIMRLDFDYKNLLSGSLFGQNRKRLWRRGWIMNKELDYDYEVEGLGYSYHSLVDYEYRFG